jgi:hypothetical protein
VRRVLRDRTFHTAIVTLKAGSSFRGVLYAHDREALVLRNVEMLAEPRTVTPVDGELVVLFADVLYLQFI